MLSSLSAWGWLLSSPVVGFTGLSVVKMVATVEAVVVVVVVTSVAATTVD